MLLGNRLTGSSRSGQQVTVTREGLSSLLSSGRFPVLSPDGSSRQAQLSFLPWTSSFRTTSSLVSLPWLFLLLPFSFLINLMVALSSPFLGSPCVSAAHPISFLSGISLPSGQSGVGTSLPPAVLFLITQIILHGLPPVNLVRWVLFMQTG